MLGFDLDCKDTGAEKTFQALWVEVYHWVEADNAMRKELTRLVAAAARRAYDDIPRWCEDGLTGP